MEPLTLATIAKWTDGTLLRGDPGLTVRSLSIDSRRIQAGDLFLAIKGETFDGHDFLGKAAAAGAVCLVSERDTDTGCALIQVKDTLAALQRLAGEYRKTLPLRVVAITGSNGKTSTKDFTAAVLGERFKVLKTEGNLNNHIGVPLTLLRATAADEVGVIEIGMNHPGEIAPLAALAAPEVAIVTNVGVAHIEFMGSQEAIAAEKATILGALQPGGCAVLNADDALCASMEPPLGSRRFLAGLEAGEIRACEIKQDVDGSRFKIETGTGSVQAELSVPGLHMVRNAMLAVGAGIFLGLTPEQSAAGLAKVRLTKGRLERKTIKGICVLDDSYNANPDSVVAALRTLSALPVTGSRIAVLGRMGELGSESERGHRQVGEAAGRERIDCVLSVGGTEADQIAEAAKAGGVGRVLRAASTEEAVAVLRDLAKPGDLVLVKGSRSAGMERIVEGLAS